MRDGRYNRTGCLDHFKVLNNTNPAYVSQNPAYFYSNSTQLPQLTLQGCRELCGPRWGPYPDNGARLFGWILPLVLLLANISYPAAGIGTKRFFLILRVLGDPISTLLSHLMILKMWVSSSHEASEFISSLNLHQNIEGEARNAVTVILVAKARYIRSPSLNHAVDEALKKLCDEKLSLLEREARFRTLLRTGFVLAGLRVIDIRRSAFAIIVYIVGVIAVFSPAIGGSPSPSGGRVSPAQLLTFLLPLVLVNNALGDVTSWRTVEDVLESFAMETVGWVDFDNIAARHNSDIVSRAVIGPWNPQRAAGVMAERPHYMQRVGLAIIAVFPVLLSFTIATAVDITPPTGPSCRAVFNLLAAITWCLSAGITTCLVSRRRSLGKWLSILVLLKDSFVGIPIFVVVTASASGLFNSCLCSSGIIWRGRRRARVDLAPEWAYAHNKKVYIASVIVGLTFQIFFFAMVVCKYRKVFALIWTDREASRTLTRLHSGSILREHTCTDGPSAIEEGAAIELDAMESIVGRHGMRSATV